MTLAVVSCLSFLVLRADSCLGVLRVASLVDPLGTPEGNVAAPLASSLALALPGAPVGIVEECSRRASVVVVVVNALVVVDEQAVDSDAAVRGARGG